MGDDFGFNPFEDNSDSVGDSSSNSPSSSSGGDFGDDIWGSATETPKSDNSGNDFGDDIWGSATDTPSSGSSDNIDIWGDSNNSGGNFEPQMATKQDVWGDNGNKNGGNNGGATKKPIKLGYKTVGAIIGIGAILLAIVIFIISKINVSEKEPEKKLVSSNSVTQAVTPTPEEVEEEYADIECWFFNPEDTDGIDLNSEEQFAKGKVTAKDMAIFRSETSNIDQIGCRLEISVDIGANKAKLSYFCSKNVWDAISVGQELDVYYVALSNGYISIGRVEEAE